MRGPLTTQKGLQLQTRPLPLSGFFLKFLGVTYLPEFSGPRSVQIVRRVLQFWYNAHTIYFPVHLIFFLLRWQKFKKNKLKALYKAFEGWVKSCTFATGFASIVLIASIDYPKLVGPLTSKKGFVLSGAASTFILCEAASRWAEMSTWVLAQWFEGMLTSFKKRKMFTLLRNLPLTRVSLTLSFGFLIVF